MPLCEHLNPKSVKLWTLDILRWMVEGGPQARFQVKEIADHFTLNIREAYGRVTLLRKWGMVKLMDRSKPRTYVVTRWGLKFLQDRDKS